MKSPESRRSWPYVLGRFQAIGVRDTLGTVTTKPFPLVVYTPLGITALLVVWAVLVSPHSKYGDAWAIVPALLTLPLVVGVHVLLAYKAQWRNDFVASDFFIAHCSS
jgi:hypothetical protein